MRYLLAIMLLLASSANGAELTRLTDATPFPRGLAMADPDGDGIASLYVLSRGRARGNGGANVTVDDKAGTIWEVDPTTGRTRVFAEPTSPPFRLLDRTLADARDDKHTDRPYCGLRYDEATHSFYIVAFSGIDLPAADVKNAESGYFRKNYSDGVLRYDIDAEQWSVVDRHEPRDGDAYPGTAGGYAKGPNNLAIVGSTLIVAAKDNNRLIAYPLEQPGAAKIVLAETISLSNMDGSSRTVLGHSALGYHDGWLYVGFRTSGEIIRLRLEDPTQAELLAEFEPFDPETGRSANVTDLAIGPDGDIYVLSAVPARVYRFTPDPTDVRNFRDGSGAWLDAASLTGNARMKAENLLITGDGTLYLASGDAYADDSGLGGAVWVYR